MDSSVYGGRFSTLWFEVLGTIFAAGSYRCGFLDLCCSIGGYPGVGLQASFSHAYLVIDIEFYLLYS